MARFAVGLSVVLFVLAPFSLSQSDPGAGIQLFSTNHFGIDLASSNVNIQAPARSKIGKLPFSSMFVGNSHAYFKSTTQWGVNSTFGIYISPLLSASGTVGGTCPTRTETNITLIDGTGAQHSVPNATVNLCSGHYNSGTWGSTDGSGYTLVVSNGSFVVYDPRGIKNTFNAPLTGYNASFTATDPDLASVYVNTSNSEWIDSLGVAALTVGGSSSVTTYSYLDASSNTQEYSVNYGSDINLLTNFKCSGIAEFGSVLTPITLTNPDGSQYILSYEQTPGKSGYYTGRVASITFPAGGSISYAYSDSSGHNGINCTSGVVPR
jgi:hypothetical protein